MQFKVILDWRYYLEKLNMFFIIEVTSYGRWLGRIFILLSSFREKVTTHTFEVFTYVSDIAFTARKVLNNKRPNTFRNRILKVKKFRSLTPDSKTNFNLNEGKIEWKTLLWFLLVLLVCFPRKTKSSQSLFTVIHTNFTSTHINRNEVITLIEQHSFYYVISEKR